MSRPEAPGRADYPVFRTITTRWMDNDVYGHVSNVVYYSFFDTAVSGYLVDQGAVDYNDGATIGLVVDTRCSYFAPISFPETVHAGIRVDRLGTSSVTYGVGIFADDHPTAAAAGYFIHVYVDKQTRRPVALPEALKQALARLSVT